MDLYHLINYNYCHVKYKCDGDCENCIIMDLIDELSPLVSDIKTSLE